MNTLLKIKWNEDIALKTMRMRVYTCIFEACAWKLALETFFPERSLLLNIKALNLCKKVANPPTNKFIKILKI